MVGGGASSAPSAASSSSSSTPAAAAAAASSNLAPKILLAKPAGSRPDASAAGGASSSSSGVPPAVVKLMRGGDRDRDRDREDDGAGRPRLTHGSLSLISESWDIFPDRLLPLMSDNTDFTVIGVLGPPGVGKSTILNELYGFDSNAVGASPPFSVQSDEIKAMARHCSVGVELRMCAERIILLDTQPLFSASVLTDLMRPDGTSSVCVLAGETLSAELAHEIMGIQLGVFLASVCHVLLLVTEGLHDISLWRLMLTVEMLKQGIPDPTLVVNVASNGSLLQQSMDKDEEDCIQEETGEFFADTVFIHTKLREHECSWHNVKSLKKALSLYFPSPAFRRNGAVQYMFPQFGVKALPQGCRSLKEEPQVHQSGHHSIVGLQNSKHVEREEPEESSSADSIEDDLGVNFFVLPLRVADDAVRMQHESYTSMVRQLHDQILSMPRQHYARSITERDWLRNSARIWDIVKKSTVLADYSRTLQNSGLYRR